VIAQPSFIGVASLMGDRGGAPGCNQNVHMGLIIVLAMLIQYGAGSLTR